MDADFPILIAYLEKHTCCIVTNINYFTARPYIDIAINHGFTGGLEAIPFYITVTQGRGLEAIEHHFRQSLKALDHLKTLYLPQIEGQEALETSEFVLLDDDDETPLPPNKQQKLIE